LFETNGSMQGTSRTSQESGKKTWDHVE